MISPHRGPALTAPDSPSLSTIGKPKASSLGLRLASSFLLIAGALVVTLIGSWAFAICVAVLGVLMMLEWQSLTGLSRTSPPAVLQSAVIIAVAAFAAAGYPAVAIAVLGLGALGAGIAARVEKQPLGLAIAGVFAIGVPALASIWLREMPHGSLIILWLFAVVWASDSGAYGVGRIIGGPSFVPSVSPNKTWAGVIGGFTAACLAGVAAAFLLFDTNVLTVWVPATVLAALAAQAGDISESAFKRHVEVKDSGTLIPGHGGVLDRLDGFLMASTVIALWVLLASFWSLP